MPQAKLSQRLAVLGVLAPQKIVTTEVVSSYADFSKAGSMMVIVNVGVTSDAATVKLYKASDTSGTGSTAFASTALTTASSNKQWVYDLRNAAFGDTSKHYVAVGIDGGDTNGVYVSAVILGGDGGYEIDSNAVASGTVVSV